MVAPRFRRKKKVFRKSPGKKKVVLYIREKTKPRRCALCGRKLGGIPRSSGSELRKLSKTQKRPERMFAGILCPSCVSTILKEKLRLDAGKIKRSAIAISHLKYIDMIKGESKRKKYTKKKREKKRTEKPKKKRKAKKAAPKESK